MCIKVQFNAYLPSETAERARSAAFFSRQRLGDLVADAVDLHVSLMELERGREFPERTESLKKGRPLSR